MRIQLRQHQNQLILLAGAILQISSLNTRTMIGISQLEDCYKEGIGTDRLHSAMKSWSSEDFQLTAGNL